MTPEEIQARQDEIRSRLTEIDTEFNGKALPEELRAEFENLVSEREELERLDAELTARREQIERAAKSEKSVEAGFNVQKPRARGKEIYDLSTVRGAVNDPAGFARELTERAKHAIEDGVFDASSVDPDVARVNAMKLLETKDTKEGTLARRMLETGSPEYKRAFGKKLGGVALTDEETRALSTGNGSGGYAIPFTLDPSVIHTSAQSINPFRAISRVVQVTGDNWQGITSAGVSASYVAEATQATDDSPTFDQPSIHVEKAHCFVPFSHEIGEDWSALIPEITLMIQEEKDDLEADRFAFGDGSDKPQGVLIGGTVDYTTAGTAAFAVADVYGVEEALPVRHRQRASWVASRPIYNKIRQFDTQGGANLWTENLRVGLNNQVPGPGFTGYDVIGYPAYECSTMSGAVTGGGTIGIVGDFSKFVIAERIGMSVEIIPTIFGADQRPTGQRGIYAHWRNSSKVIDPNAFRRIRVRS